jgi:hypothetical protein
VVEGGQTEAFAYRRALSKSVTVQVVAGNGGLTALADGKYLFKLLLLTLFEVDGSANVLGLNPCFWFDRGHGHETNAMVHACTENACIFLIKS